MLLGNKHRLVIHWQKHINKLAYESQREVYSRQPSADCLLSVPTSLVKLKTKNNNNKDVALLPCWIITVGWRSPTESLEIRVSITSLGTSWYLYKVSGMLRKTKEKKGHWTRRKVQFNSKQNNKKKKKKTRNYGRNGNRFFCCFLI